MLSPVTYLHFDTAFFRQASGDFNDADYEVMKTRSIYNMSDAEKEEVYSKSVKLCAKNRDLLAFNLHRLKQLRGPKAVVKAENTPQIAATASSSTAGMLFPQSRSNTHARPTSQTILFVASLQVGCQMLFFTLKALRSW